MSAEHLISGFTWERRYCSRREETVSKKTDDYSMSHTGAGYWENAHALLPRLSPTRAQHDTFFAHPIYYIRPSFLSPS